METKTFFDAWLETQKQLMNNWAESNAKLQESVKSGSALKDGMSIYQEWLSKQAEITKNANEKAAEAFKTQVNETTEAFNNGKSGANLSDIYNNWVNAQKELSAKAFENFKSFSQPFTANNSFANDSMNQFQNFQNQWWNTTQSWMNQAQHNSQNWFAPFQNWNKGFNDDTMKEAWNNMTNASGAFVKFYEMWAPVYKNMVNNQFSAEWMKNSFNPEAFRELMDKTVASISPVQYKELYQQWTNWTEVASNYSKHVYQQFAGNVPDTMKNLFPYLAFGNNPENPYNNVFSIYQRAFTPLVKLFTPGKEAELNEHMTAIGEKLSVYGQKLAELQQHIYATGAKSWENFLLDSFEQVKKGADLSNTQEAFQNWVNKNEEVFIGLFRSENYSKLQGELLDLGLGIKQHSEKVGEILLQPLPVVLRSEADELYTTIYELRKRVHALEKQLGETTEESKETKTSRKKAATA
jgi:hypothetical protein